MDHYCILKDCNGKLEYYKGLLGYEAFICQNCDTHYKLGLNEISLGERYLKKLKGERS